MEFADSNRVCGEREVCTNRCVIVGSLWAILGQREGEGGGEGEGEGEGAGWDTGFFKGGS